MENWIAVNWVLVVSIMGIVSGVATVVNLALTFTPDKPKPNGVVAWFKWAMMLLIDLASFSAQRGAVGVSGTRLSVPGVRSHLGSGTGVPRAPLALAVVFFAFGCNDTIKSFGIDLAKCALGQAPVALTSLVAQTIASATDAPTAPSWSDFGRDLGLTVGIDAAKCATAAALHTLETSLSPRGIVAPRTRMGITRLQEWQKANP